MKPAYIFTLEALAILALLIAAMFADEALDGEAAQWLEIANNAEDIEGNGYYYLIGIGAAASEDPQSFGERQLVAYRETEAAMLKDGTGMIDFAWEQSLPLPGGDVYCRNQEDGCLRRLFGDPAALRRELDTHAVLLGRYREFIAFPAFKTLSRPFYSEIFPPYRYVSLGNRLGQFQVMLDVMQGNRARALDALYQDIANFRRHLAIADTLIYKLVLTAMLAENLELLANVYDLSVDPAMPPITLLTDEERSLRRPMIREFTMSANTLLYFDKHPQAFSEELNVPAWAVRPVYKSHMTVNDAFRIHRSNARLALLSPPAFYQSVNAGMPRIQAPFSLRNLLGWLLGLMASGDAYSSYIARINDINCKIALVNTVLPLDRAQWMEIIEGSTAVPAVENPYDPGLTPYVDPENRSLCFSGPYEDERGFRCVKKYRVDSEQSVDM